MAGTYNEQYGNLDLINLADKISKDFDEPVAALCHSVKSYSSALMSDYRFNKYIDLCMLMINKIEDYLDIHQHALIEYVEELNEKNKTGHNCLHCSGKCHVQHQMQLTNVTYLSREIKQLFCNVFEIFSIPDNIILDENYKQQRLSLMLLDKIVTELFYVHESYLMPAILEAQININAFS